MGAAMTRIHLPEDIGDNQSRAGEMPIAQSYPFVLAEDSLIQYIGVFPPTSSAEKINPIHESTSETTIDAFALSRKVKSSVLFRNVSNYDIEPNQWGIQLSDTTDGDTMPQGSKSVLWAQRVNARVFHPGSLTEVKFLPQVSAIQVRSYPVASNTGYQQAILYSNRVFTAGTNPILVTISVSMTLSDNPNCSKTWGLFSGNSGYFFRIYGTGVSDNFKVGYRRTLGETINEIEIPRSQFNGNKLDGTNGHNQTFTNVGMFGVEVGTAGLGARFWAYVEIGGSARWVLVHSLYNDSDSSQDRITDEEGLPVSFEVKNVGQSTTLQTLSKYGTSVTSLGKLTGAGDITSVRTSKIMYALNKRPFPLLGIRAKDYINNKKNFSNILATRINILSSSRITRIVLIKNPKRDSNSWLNLDNISGIQYRLDRELNVDGGIDLCHFLVAQNKPLSISLKDIFSLNRSFLTARYTNDAQEDGDFGAQFFKDSDEIWICSVDAGGTFPINNTELIWNPVANTQAVATYENAYLNNSKLLSTTINISLNVMEVY
jgi:hypothetical protein